LSFRDNNDPVFRKLLKKRQLSKKEGEFFQPKACKTIASGKIVLPVLISSSYLEASAICTTHARLRKNAGKEFSRGMCDLAAEPFAHHGAPARAKLAAQILRHLYRALFVVPLSWWLHKQRRHSLQTRIFPLLL
jgi:hypothetical protein